MDNYTEAKNRLNQMFIRYREALDEYNHSDDESEEDCKVKMDDAYEEYLSAEEAFEQHLRTN